MAVSARQFLILLELAALPARAVFADDPVDLATQVRPLLVEHCYSCHGAEKQRGALRLDSRAALLAGGNSGTAIVTGKSAESVLLRRVRGEGDEKRMPLGHDPLTAAQIEVLARWVDSGADWPTNFEAADAPAAHWSYVVPQRAALPTVQRDNWARNEIDRFILARLEKEGMSPAAPADRYTLLRRVCLDLVGLPPTPAQMERFLAGGDDAYEQLVDELLASPRYGERWARPWLDLARYADSNGYEKDRLRTMWPYRDWVIDALNRDVPFDEFTLEQLAGDMLPNATLSQQIASGFHRNSMLNEEGGVDLEEYRHLTVVDRVNTTATTWLGTTLACAQCHNHKFDPLSQKDYYQFYAFFNSTPLETRHDEINDTFENSPKVRIPLPGEEKIRIELAALDRSLSADAPDLAADFAAWEKVVGTPVEWRVLDPNEFDVRGGETTLALPDRSVLLSGANPDTAEYRFAAYCGISKVTAIRIETLADDALGPARGPGRTPHGNFVLSRLRLRAPPARNIGADAGAPPFAAPSADFEQRTGDEYWAVAGAVDNDPRTGWAIVPQGGRDHAAIFPLQSPVYAVGFAVYIDLTLEQSFGSQHNIGRLRVSVTNDEGDARRDSLPAELRTALATQRADRTPAQQSLLREWFIDHTPRYQAIRDQRAALQRRLDAAPTTLVMQELAQPRETHMLLRGNFMTPGDAVQPDVPRVLPPLPPDLPRNRLGLARWLTSRDNPLTARVQVNRIWEQHFGRGLVATSEDFGVQGEPPTHPELLDWLACEFMERGWSLKSLHRLIVTSATYRQSSAVTPALLQADPYDKLLARMPRVRLEAELIRDQALAAGGLLSEKMGGPSVMPLQPPGIWAAASSGQNNLWMTSSGEDRYRRGIYTFWRRSSPYPSMVTFDAPNREVVCTRRPRTNTPLQALTTLNDPEFLTPAAAVAQRVLDDPRGTPERRIDHLFRLVLARPPSTAEARRLSAYVDEQRSYFHREWVAGEALRAAAPLPGALTATHTPEPSGAMIEHAAWTMAASVLLNLDETLTRG